MIDLPDWLSPAQPYLLALSGGRDSVCLLHLLSERGFKKIIPCHLNHQLRGQDADEDSVFVRDLCRKLHFPAEIAGENIRRHAGEMGESLETAARDCRRRFFARCAKKHGISRILLAHHAEDQAETILFNLLRGSGGLKGMRETSPHEIDGQALTFLRPLLKIRRSAIDRFLSENEIPYREDRSNADPFATRNRLRHEALPLLRDILARDPAPALTRATEIQSENENALDELLSKLGLTDPQGRLFLPKIRRLGATLQKRILLKYLRQEKIPELSHALIERAISLIPADAEPALTLPGGKRLRRKEARLFVEK